MRDGRDPVSLLLRAGAALAVLVALSACEDTSSTGPVPASVAIVAGDSQRGTVGQPLDSALTVEVHDWFGTPVSGVLVRFETTPSQGQLDPPVAPTGQDGRAHAVWTLPTVSGEYTAKVSVDGVDSLTFTATAVAALPAVVTLDMGGGQIGEVGQPLDSALRVRVRDSHGNPVAGVAVAFQVVKGSSTPATPAAVTDSAGLAQTAWLLGPAAGYDTMLISVTGAPPVAAEAIVFPIRTPDSLAAGGDLTCRMDGTAVRCWGGGEGFPVSMTSLPTLTAISAGTFEVCGLDSGGAAWCWGPPWDASPPTSPAPGIQFVQLSAGNDYTCGVTASGVAHCRYQAGAFQPVPGNLVFRQVGAGFLHVCGVTRDGRSYCWGDDSYEQLGNGGGGSSAVPVAVATTERFHLITAGTYQSCGLTADGRMFCWGTLSQGATPYSAPTRVYQGRRFVDVDAGFFHTCGVQTDGQGACFGDSDVGQLGGASAITAGPLGFRRIAAGSRHSCGVAQDGTTWCWGDNRAGAVGIGPTAQRNVPDSVVGGQLFAQVFSGAVHSCGLTPAGAAWCWGNGNAGQLGNGVAGTNAAPVAVSGGHGFVRLSAGSIETCGVTPAGAGFCWGALGGSSVPAPVPGGYTFTSISVGELSACGVTTVGDAVCWGRNADGQLGDSTSIFSSETPVKVVGGLTFADVAVGGRFACGVTTSHQAWCWGTAALGDGSFGSRSWPGPVSGGLALDRIAASGTNDVACAITTADEAWCWGQGADGQLGDGTVGTPAPTPVPVSGGHRFSSLSLANNSTCGLTTTGTALCWGYGQLGDGSGAASAVPVPVLAGPGTLSITTAGQHGCLVDAGGSARCWGSNSFGQLGIGVTGFLFTPVPVP